MRVIAVFEVSDDEHLTNLADWINDNVAGRSGEPDPDATVWRPEALASVLAPVLGVRSTVIANAINGLEP